MLQTPQLLRQNANAVTNAFNNNFSESAFLRLYRSDEYRPFVVAATSGRIQLNLPLVYQQLADQMTILRQEFGWSCLDYIVNRPNFPVSAVDDAACRVTPLGQYSTTNTCFTLSHTSTVVQQCCRIDCARQRGSLKFDPSPRPNPLTYL